MANKSVSTNDDNQFPMYCPNYCNELVTSEDDLAKHRLKCQFETINCYLCGATRARKYFEEHRKLEPQYCLLKGQFNQLHEELKTEFKEILESRLKQITDQREDNKRLEQSLNKQLLQIQNHFYYVTAMVVAVVIVIMAIGYARLASSTNVQEFSRYEQLQLMNTQLPSNVLQRVHEMEANISQLWNITIVNQTQNSKQLQEIKDEQHQQLQEVLLQLKDLKTNLDQLRNDLAHSNRELQETKQYQQQEISQQLTQHVQQLQEVKVKYDQEQSQQINEIKASITQLESVQTQSSGQLQEIKYQQKQLGGYLQNSVTINQAIETQHKISLTLESINKIITAFQVEGRAQVNSFSTSDLQTAHYLSKQIQEKDSLDSTALWKLLLLLSPYAYSVDNQVVPVILNLSEFNEMKNKEEWFSEPFFAFEGGYKMCLGVYAAGVETGKGTHVSAGVFLMKGPYDNELEQSGHFPVRGTFTIELLNQLNDENHHSVDVEFGNNGDTYNKLVDNNISSRGWGRQQFISHVTLASHVNNGYLIDDRLYFRVSYNDVMDTIQNEKEEILPAIGIFVIFTTALFAVVVYGINNNRKLAVIGFTFWAGCAVLVVSSENFPWSILWAILSIGFGWVLNQMGKLVSANLVIRALCLVVGTYLGLVIASLIVLYTR